MNIKDGKRQEYTSGALRSDHAGRGRFDLISPHALLRLAIQYEIGGIQKGDRNWEQGFPCSRAICSAIRHLMQQLTGDRSEDHYAATAWQVFCAMHFEVLIEQGKLPVALNDIPFDPSTLPPDTGAVDEPAPRSLSEIQKDVGSWGNTMFPKSDNIALCEHLRREVIELKASWSPEEAADCLLILLHFAHKNDFDLLTKAIEKQIVNENRVWSTKPDSQGVYPHIDKENNGTKRV